MEGSATETAHRSVQRSTSPAATGRRRRRARFTIVVVSAVLGAALAMPAHVEAAGRDQAAAQGWTSQFVGSARDADSYSYAFTGIGVGPLGRAVLMYADGPNRQGGFDLRLGRGPLDDGSLRTESIDPDERRLAGESSLVVGPKGRAYVSFTKGVFIDQGVLKYAASGPDGWSVETVDDAKSVGITELALGPHHTPYIAYGKTVFDPVNGPSFQLWLATKSQGVWTKQLVVGERVWALDLALDAEGRPEIAYVTDTGVGVQNIAARIARFGGTSWSFEDIGHVVNGGIEFGIDLLIDADGHEDVVYPVWDPDPGMMYGHYDGTSWQTQLIDAGNLWQPSMAYDPDGGVHVTYYDADAGALKYASLSGGVWDVQTIADNPLPQVRIGRLSSLAFGPDGRAHVAYYVGKEFKGTFARYAVSAPPGRSGHAAPRTPWPSSTRWTTERTVRVST